MTKPLLIDLLRDARKLEAGDIIAFDRFPAGGTRLVTGSSGLPIDSFHASPKEPRFRGLVLTIDYDSKNGDKVLAIQVLPLAGVEKSLTVPNDEKNLMVARKAQIAAMGLDVAKNWRVNYQLTALAPTATTMGTDKADFVLKVGRAPVELFNTVFAHAERLSDMGILDTLGVLRGRELARSQGTLTRDFGNLVGGEVGNRSGGNRHDTAALTVLEQRKRAEAAAIRAAQKEQELQAKRDNLAELKSSPSGRLGYRELRSKFNELANPDITLEDAKELEVLSKEHLDDLQVMALEAGTMTLRQTYDFFVQDHQGALDALLLSVCEEDVLLEVKAKLEKSLHDALIGFYGILQAQPGKPEAEKRPKAEAATIPFAKREP